MEHSNLSGMSEIEYVLYTRVLKTYWYLIYINTTHNIYATSFDVIFAYVLKNIAFHHTVCVMLKKID